MSIVVWFLFTVFACCILLVQRLYMIFIAFSRALLALGISLR